MGPEEQLWDCEGTTVGGAGEEEAMDSRGLGGVLDYIKEYPIGRTMYPASLRPPSLTGGDDSSSSYILIDVKAYITDRVDATTAKSFTRGRHEIQATLCAARPPRVSHLCVYCPALTPSDFGTEPRILAISDDLIMLKAAICLPSICDEHVMQDFFIYHAAPTSEERATGTSSLTRLPHPGPNCHFGISSFGLVRCDDSGYVLRRHGSVAHPDYIVAYLCKDSCKLGEPNELHLHRFKSGDSRWTTTVLHFTPTKPSPGLTFFSHITHKVITLGGGFMGWVDLCQGILLCNVLDDVPEISFIPLPQLLDPDGDLPGNARTVRDVAVVNGHLKYVEHKTHIKKLTLGSYVSDNWRAATSSWKINLKSWKGHWQDRLDCDGSRILGSLSDLLGYKSPATLPPLSQLHTGLPTLSLDEDDIVFFLAKVDHRDDKAFLLGVNMRTGTIEVANRFDAERMVGIGFAYTQMRVSHYLTPESKLIKRIGGRDLGSSIVKKHRAGVSILSYCDDES